MFRYIHIGILLYSILSIPLLVQANPLKTVQFTSESFRSGDILLTPVSDYTLPVGVNGNFVYGSATSEGYNVTLQPGDATLIMTKEPIQTGQESVVVTLEYTILAGNAEIAVAALNSVDGTPDGQLGYTLFEDYAPESLDSVRRLHTVYRAQSGEFVGAVQVALSEEATENATVLIYNFSIYPLNDGEAQQIATTPDGSFSTSSDDLITNINLDKGTVHQDAEHQRIILSVAGNGEAANAGVNAADPESIEDGSLLIGKADISRISGNDGMSAMVITNGDWSSGVFFHNSNVPEAPEKYELITGGLYYSSGEPLYAFVQNGGGENAGETAAYNLALETLSSTSIVGLPEPVEFDVSSSVAATLLLPKTLYLGSKSDYSLTAVDSKSKKPVSLPYEIWLSGNDQSYLVEKGITKGEQSTPSKWFSMMNAGLASSSGFDIGNYQISVKSYGNEILTGQLAIQKGGVLFIETDKPIYKPAQKIQGRVVLLNNALAPLAGDVELTINDAEGIKIHRDNLTTNEYGVASFELPLANELNFGTWKITAKYGTDVQIEKDIVVDKYVLPAFEVNVNMPKDWFLVDERVQGTIDSRFFFGKPVQGNVHIEALRYVGTWETYSTVDARLEDGIYAFDLPPVGYIAGTPAEEGAGTLQLKITVTDDTGHEENTDQLLRIVDAGVNVKLIPESPVIKPGLNQEIMIITETPGGQLLNHAVELEITFFATDGTDFGSNTESIQTENGMALYQFNVPERATMGTVVARATMDGKTEEETLVLNAVYSPGSHYIHLRQQNDEILQVGEDVIFNVFATDSGTVFYDVYANGRTVFSQATETRQIQFTVTPEMSPQARVVAYMIQQDNEVSVDVLPFTVEIVAPVNLNTSFSAEEVRPGDPVNLSMQSGEQSMIGLAVVDESVFALAEGRLNLRNVFAELERIFMEPKAEVHQGDEPQPEPGPIFRPTNSMPDFSQKGAADILDESNLQMITSKSVSLPKAEPVDPWKFMRGNFPIPFPLPPELVLEDAAGGAEGGEYQEPERVRTFFPETWIWQPELLTDENGNAQLELTAPDSITTWKLHALSTSQSGLGIAEGSLRVFQDFFVEPDLPYAVIRGDRFPLSVRIFNYVDQEQTIRITLEDAEGLGLQDDPVQEIIVPGNGLASVSFTLEPTKVGMIPISLIAQSANRADAIRKELRVEPEGVRRNIVHNGILRDATSVTIDLSLPEPPILRDPIPTDPTIIPPEFEIVPDSEFYRVAITPSLLGQSMTGLEKLLEMPFGCGEQNMMFLAPDIEILRYLKATGQLMPEIRAKAEYFVTTGYQRQLTFRRTDGSFSAFGQQDDSGSLWLTAFVLSTFSNAREIRTIDADVIDRAAEWIVGHQQDDGSWDPVGFVVHSEMIGGMDGNLALTAFVVNALLEYGETDQTVIDKALAYLERNLTNEEMNPYILAQIAYAFTQAESTSAEQAINLLIEVGIADADGLHWEPYPIETTGYAVLALLNSGKLIEAQPAIEWLAVQRNHLGGFGNTQDTVLAFKSLTSAAINQSRDLDAQIEVLVDGETVHIFTVNSENFDVFQALEIDRAEQIELRQSGTGTVLFQVLQAFNVPVTPMDETQSPEMTLRVEYSSEHVAVDDIVDVNVYTHYFGEKEKTGMAIVDVSVPTGFAVVQESLERVKEIETISRIEQAGWKIIFYVDYFESATPLEFTFQVKARFPVKADSGTSAAYLYYDETTRTEAGGTQLVAD